MQNGLCVALAYRWELLGGKVESNDGKSSRNKFDELSE
jgi:hypothetical protein